MKVVPLTAEHFLRSYVENAKRLLESVAVTDLHQAEKDFYVSVSQITDILKSFQGQIIIIGNGGSAGIASEVAHRFQKFCGIRGITFNDPVMMSSTANDCDWAMVFGEPIKVYGQAGDILIAISSSGNSPNIVLPATKNGLGKKFSKIITLSGFESENLLRNQGDFNFYVPSRSYRHVERTHLFVLDCILDLLIEHKNGGIDENQRVD